jgi:hypothetical protein
MRKDFDLEAMRKAVESCDRNILVFEEAIRKERGTKAEYQEIIRVLEEKERNQPVVRIEIEREE